MKTAFGETLKSISGRAKRSLSRRSRSQTGSWYWNVKTGEVRWSAEHFRLFGYDPATTQPSYQVFVEPIHPEDRPSIEQTIATAVAEKGQFQLEYRIVLPDGTHWTQEDGSRETRKRAAVP